MGVLSQGREGIPGELRASSDLALSVLLDSPLCLPHPSPTGLLLLGSQTHQAHSCLMVFAHAMCMEDRTHIFTLWVLSYSVLGSNVTSEKPFPGHPSVILGDIILLFLQALTTIRNYLLYHVPHLLDCKLPEDRAFVLVTAISPIFRT